MIVYTFIFIDEDGNKIKKDIWARFETEAWNKADDWAFKNGYVDYKIAEE